MLKKKNQKMFSSLLNAPMSDNVEIENPDVNLSNHVIYVLIMKSIELPKILDCLKNKTNEILIDFDTINRARSSIERMIAIGRQD